MSYIQGTKVRVIGEFVDVDTGAAATGLDEVIVTVEPPDGTVTQLRLSQGDVNPMPGQAGAYYAVIDTAPASGMWNYQFESIGADAVVGRKQITVKQRIPAPT